MKKLLSVVSIAVFAAACSSNSTNTRSNADATTAYGQTNSQNAKYQIIDQEFDNLLASGTDYDNLSDYELQACGAAYLPPQQELKTVSPKTEVVVVKENDLKTDTKRKKKVTNTVNIYEMNGNTPKKVSSSSTTTVTTSSSSSSTANGATTYNSTGSTSTSSTTY